MLLTLEQFIQKVQTGKLKLLADGKTNFKMNKSETKSYGLSLAPHTLNSQKKSVCPFASKGCIDACINMSGNGVFSYVQHSRMLRSDYYLTSPKSFSTQLYNELSELSKRATKQNTNYAIRLNVFSDIDWIKEIKRYTSQDITELTGLQYYDYTKSVKKALDYQKYPNYSITFSRSETNWKDCLELLQKNINVTVVFGSSSLPDTFFGFPVINGDLTDERWNDHQGVIVGLKAKGHLGKKDQTGFVYRQSIQTTLV